MSLVICATNERQLGKLRGDDLKMDQSRVGELCQYKEMSIQKYIVLVHLDLQTPYNHLRSAYNHPKPISTLKNTNLSKNPMFKNKK